MKNTDIFYNKYFKKYEEIVRVVGDRAGTDNYSLISQKEIAKELNISQSLVSKCLIRLERIDRCIEKVAPSVYKVNHIDMRKYGPYAMFIKYVAAFVRDINFIDLKATERADIINGCEDDVIMCAQYFNLFSEFIL